MPGFFELAGIAAGSFGLALSGALSPGPLLVTAIREGARQGARAGPLLTLGHGVLEAAVIVLIAFQLAPLVDQGRPFGVMALAGGAVLLVMGALMLREAPKASTADLFKDVPAGGKPGALWGAARTALAGAAVSLSNPYWALWWLGSGAWVLKAAKSGWPGLLAFFTGHILADLGWYWLVTFAVSRGHRLFSDRGYRLLMGGCALFLIGFAGYFLWLGAREFSAAAGSAR